ncbi:unnamed protein product [Ixodes pacificus]
MRPYGPPPKFKGSTEEDLEHWLRVYDRYAKALTWSDTQKADNLVVVLEEEARRWYSAILRGPTPEKWEEWKTIQRDFAGEEFMDWVFLQLQEKRQQLGETPQQCCVSSMPQLCARAEPDMSEVNTVRGLHTSELWRATPSWRCHRTRFLGSPHHPLPRRSPSQSQSPDQMSPRCSMAGKQHERQRPRRRPQPR